MSQMDKITTVEQHRIGKAIGETTLISWEYKMVDMCGREFDIVSQNYVHISCDP